VNLDKYRLGTPHAAQGKLWSKLKDHFRKNQQRDKKYTLPLVVNGKLHPFASTDELLRRVVSPYYGKGSPEDCQITLQIAVLLGETSKGQLQKYSDDYLGLDCNGFVGNYMWHEWAPPAPWNQDAQRDDPGPSSLISSLLKFGTEIKTIDEIRPEKIHIFGLVDSAFKVVPGGSARIGHLMITEPSRFMKSYAFNSFGGLDLRLGKQGVYQSPAYWTVESTGQLGLVESWYAIQQVKGHRGRDVPGVFRVFRGSKGEFMNVRIAALD
jgi:hypothetical protein